MIAELKRSSALALYIALASAGIVLIAFGVVSLGCEGEVCIAAWPIGPLAVCTGALLLALLPGAIGLIGFCLMFIAVSAAMLLSSDSIGATIAIAVAVFVFGALIVSKRRRVGSFYRSRTRSHA